MEPWHCDDRATIYHGDCLEVLRGLPDASVDSVVTDPPYGLEFMGKEWDRPWAVTAEAGVGYEGRDDLRLPSHRDSRNANCQACGGRARGAKRCACTTPQWDRHPREDMLAFGQWCELWAAECLRVLKPGGHLLAFGGTRTWHRLAVAVEDAGFEIRDSIAWLYGSGFPKSLDVSKAIDKAAGAEREDVYADNPRNMDNEVYGKGLGVALIQRRPATPDAARWSGWGTALKPAFEPVVVARKPLTGTVAANVLEHGVGGLNIDGCRIPGIDPANAKRLGRNYTSEDTNFGDGQVQQIKAAVVGGNLAGRWPANVVLDEDQADALDKQSGPAGSNSTIRGKGASGSEFLAFGQRSQVSHDTRADGGASRFFYVAKAPARERPKVDGIAHPTVKPLTLMRWLCRLVTPPGGVVLEPFAGSGTTIEAALMEGFHVVAIEREDDYLPLIAARLERIGQEPDGQLTFDASA
jgi:site-specific DNA-methyltransferase (adenine-specific)